MLSRLFKDENFTRKSKYRKRDISQFLSLKSINQEETRQWQKGKSRLCKLALVISTFSSWAYSRGPPVK